MAAQGVLQPLRGLDQVVLLQLRAISRWILPRSPRGRLWVTGDL